MGGGGEEEDDKNVPGPNLALDARLVLCSLFS